MPDRLSRLLKATLRRRSHPTLPQDKKADSKAVDSNGPGGSSHAHVHHDHDQHHDVTTKSRAYSVVSSLPVDHPSSPDEIVAAPATPATSYSTDHQGRVVRRQYFDPVEPSPTELVPAVRPDEVVARKGSEASVLEQGKKSAERGDSLEPGPTATTTTTTATTATPTTAARDTDRPPTDDSSTSGGAAAILQNPDPFGSSSLKRPVVDPSLPPVAEFGTQPSATSSKRPSLVIRKQSLLPVSHHHWVRNLLDPPVQNSQAPGTTATTTDTTAEMQARKIWVRRPGGSPTLVPILEDAVVDELRDQVIIKYTNSLGKTFDSPDIIIRVVPREGLGKQPERLLNPDESLVAVVDAYYPGGQRVDEALVIDIPGRRTPKPSPRPVYYHNDTAEHDYFSIVPMNPSTPPTHTANSSASANAQATPSISILTTGKAPPLPSPGSTRANRHARRPPAIRHTTGSPTVGQKETVASPVQQAQTPSVPTPPIPPAPESPQAKALTPPAARGTSPRGGRPSLKDKKNTTSPFFNSAFSGLNEGTVPPINVLIVEDNIINQKLLEAFMKRLSVRWKCAGNGEEAVKKWRQGGFHLVLMDIQLPVMNGLEATKEIRRLERLNGIGVFPKTPDGRSSATNSVEVSTEGYQPSASLSEEDTLNDRTLFKSPVIIVALTASSLQSDRHEALAAGCNDFLTKPVGFPWLEQKVTEWGCMQALIDFEGWRRWRGFDNPPEDGPGPDQAEQAEQPAPTSSTLVPSPPQTDGHVSPMNSSVVKPPSPESVAEGT